MPDAISVTDLKVNFAPGDLVLVRDQPLLPPMIVDRVSVWHDGSPGSVRCVAATSTVSRYDQRELIHCPPGYEPAPVSAKPLDDLVEYYAAFNSLSTLLWAMRNRAILVSLHGDRIMTEAVSYIRQRIHLHVQILAALAEEPGAGAMRRAEIAMEELAR